MKNIRVDDDKYIIMDDYVCHGKRSIKQVYRTKT